MGATLTNQEFDDGLKAAITNSGYTYGGDSQVTSWTLTFTIDTISTFSGHKSYTLATLRTGQSPLYVVLQQPTGNVDSAYVGLSNITNDVPTAEGEDDSWVDPYHVSADGKTRTWMADDLLGEDCPLSWLSYNQNGGHVHFATTGTTFTLSSSGSKTLLTMNFSNGTTSVVEYTESVMFNVEDFTLSDQVTKIKNATLQVNDKVYSIPEPTTATLSLLALAGLAARRRRR